MFDWKSLTSPAYAAESQEKSVRLAGSWPGIEQKNYRMRVTSDVREQYRWFMHTGDFHLLIIGRSGWGFYYFYTPP
jgi:hypothetical protein